MNKTIIAKIGLALIILLGFQGLSVSLTADGIFSVFDLTLNNIDAEMGLRADLAGTMVAVPVLLLFGLLQTKGTWVWAAATIIACVFVVRIVGVVNYGFTETQGVILAIEIVLMAIMAFAARTFDRAADT